MRQEGQKVKLLCCTKDTDSHLCEVCTLPLISHSPSWVLSAWHWWMPQQHSRVIVRKELPGKNGQNQFANHVVSAEGDLEVGGSQEKADSFSFLWAMNRSSDEVLGMLRGLSQSVAQKFHSSSLCLPVTALPFCPEFPGVPTLGVPFHASCPPGRNKIFVTHAHRAGAAPQGPARFSTFPSTCLSSPLPQGKLVSACGYPKGSCSLTNQNLATREVWAFSCLIRPRDNCWLTA